LNGLFTVQLNGGGEFGANAFKGDARWLQIEVCSNPSCTAQTVLSPRQAITATPYALYSGGGGNPWINDANGIDYAGRVGIGGPAIPTARLDISSNSTDVENPVFIHTANPTYAALAFGNTAGGPGMDDRFSSSHTLAGKLYLGAGLDVLGDIKLGGNRQYFAPGGEENLRIMRGYVQANGVSLAGCCYSVAHPLAGVYDITFTTPFAGFPAVSVTPDNSSVALVAPYTNTLTSSGFRIWFHDTDVVLHDNAFSFIAIGPR
jgi:hypothetical protein